MWVGEKFQSNPEIAGSPRNSFRASLGHESCGGRALNFLGGVKAYRRISNSECHVDKTGSQTARDKLGSQKEMCIRDRGRRQPIYLTFRFRIDLCFC